MRDALIPILLAALVVPCLPQVARNAFAQAAPAFMAAGTDAAQVTAFLKTLKSAVSVGNSLKVASLVSYPLKAWVQGEETLIRNESEFQARYARIFDADLKRAVADARVETLVANEQGVRFDNGRVSFRPVAEQKNAIRIVAINEPAQTR